MPLLNIPVKGNVIQLKCEKQEMSFFLDEDVKNGEWTVKKAIKLGGPQTSKYKYDFNNYLEFVLIDKHDEARTIQWYYNGGDAYLQGYQRDNGVIDCIPFFFKEHPVFKCQDWSDYENASKLLEIANTLSKTEISNHEKLSRISRILQSK